MASLADELKQHGSLGFGAMGLSAFYGTPLPQEEAQAVLRHAIDVNYTMWDSADIYGCGTNEELIGSVLKDEKLRKKVFLATKFGAAEIDPVARKMVGPGSGKAENVRQCLDASIKRLGFTPDLYYLHRVDPNTDITETVKAMDEERKAGKFRYLGLSECSADTLRKAAKAAKIDAVQVEVSPWTTDLESNGLAAACKELGVVVVAYSPIGRGFLTGKYKSADDFEDGDFRKTNPRFSGENFDKNLKIVEELQKLAKKNDATPGQLCLAWLISKGYVPIPGSTKIKNIDENLAATKLKLSESDLAEIQDVVDRAEIHGTRYEADRMKGVNI